MIIPYENSVSTSIILVLLDTAHSLSMLAPNIELPDRASFLNPEERINERVLIDLWQLIDQESNVEGYGLLLGKHKNPSTKGLLSALISQSETLKDAFLTYTKYIDWMSPSEHWTLKENNNTLELSLSINLEKGYPIAAIERSMSSMLNWFRFLTGNEPQLISAHFNYDQPSYLEEYKATFGQNIVFSSQQNALIVKRDIFEGTLSGYNPYLKNILETKIQSAIVNSKVIENRVTRFDKDTIIDLIIIFLPQNKATIDYVCNHLSISRQTLYRYLKKENTSFKELLDETRKKRATILLSDKNKNIQYISDQLGYSEVSSFYNAFARWFNMSISYYRKNSDQIILE